MYQVAICEDDPLFSQQLSQLVKEILDEAQISFQLTVYSSAQALKKALLEEGSIIHILFLDIIMEGEDGLSLAKQLRQVEMDLAIVFVTASKEFALAGYEVKPLHYLLKPVKKMALAQLLLEHQSGAEGKEYIAVRQGTSWLRVQLAHIEFIEKMGRKTLLYEKNRKLLLSETLSQLKEMLPKSSFVRCHHGYILNIDNTIEVSRQKAITKSGAVVPISRSNIKLVEGAFLDRLYSQMRRK